MAFGRKKPRKNVLIVPNAKVGDLIEAWPETLDVLLQMGFEPLRNPIARRTVAKLFTLEQAAAFKSMPIETLLHQLKVAIGQAKPEDGPALPSTPTSSMATRTSPVGLPIAGPAGPVAGPGDTDVPELDGDVRVLGLVPCPVRGILVEAFDRFAGKLTASSGKRIAWWMAGEGTAIGDVRAWLDGIHQRGDVDRIPDVMVSVGTELFLYPQYGSYARSGLFGAFPGRGYSRPDLAPLEDPNGVLGLLFVGLFTLVCRPDRLPNRELPTSWLDLADPGFEGEVGFPSLHLPIVPDLMAALHDLMGETGFQRFAANLGATMHPAQASPRVKKADVPGVVILPTIFSRQSEFSAGGVEVVPEEGAIGVPAYVAVREGAPPEAHDVANFLCSDAFLKPCWEHGDFLPNHAGIEAELPKGRIVARSWEALAQGDPGAESDRLLKMMEGGLA
jgi:hypothetical protein